MKKIIPLLLLLFAFIACEKTTTYGGSGSVVFYTTTNSHGTITITISGETFKVPVTNDPDTYCTNGYTGYVYLDVGTFSYNAVATDGTKWSGSVEITKDYCTQKLLQ